MTCIASKTLVLRLLGLSLILGSASSIIYWWRPDRPQPRAFDATRYFDLREALDPQPEAKPLTLAARAALNDALAVAQRAPLSGYPFALHAMAEHQRGDSERAEALMKRALRLDPRSAAIRGWMMNRYLSTSRNREAIDEAAVLYQLDDSGALSSYLNTLLAKLLAVPELREAISRRFFNTPYLLNIIRVGLHDGLDKNVARDMLESGKGKRWLQGRDELIPDLLGAYIANQDFREARQVWKRFLPRHGAPQHVYDGFFVGLSGPRPFNWRLISDERIQAKRVSVKRLQPATALRVDHLERSSAVAATQYLALPTGWYRFSFMAMTPDGEAERSGAAFSWRITCRPGGNRIAEVEAVAPPKSEWRRYSAELFVGEPCSGQVLELVSPEDDFGMESILMTSVSVMER